ncbi:Cytochrome d ubiquinol oxidase subunit II [Methanosarcina siciliae T4/M]|uniref:Cytochrome d ubiquinol oxidase subunit II n=2 Tax=Methanosarcina siciliae TaxID=38027 RepID=A0A0E3PFZ9_9EURY|nr:cytochrome d ubiquinol oxidase subunit II [Methanosarcina siciliae]AKB29767.1 Cytochrome d ubiquinol oxidase subunit II [Methanosarcina siciliae T4/M]AKB33680.1 Cytochrome d ubiquinol oxidase subunit II [Methanosarcina siciliae HI350]
MFDFLTHDMLAVIWFFLWCVIWGVYFIADSFSLGAGLLTPFIAEDKAQRVQIQSSVGPFWGGNEVWLILAAGGTFAAFPLVFSKMFTFLYLPMILLLIGLIARGISVEYLHKDDNPRIQKVLMWGWFTGSLLISLVLGVAFANFFKGLEIVLGGFYVGTLLELFGPYALVGGALFVLMNVTSGALWINVKTEGDVAAKAGDLAKKSTLLVLVLALVYLAYSFAGIEGFTSNYSAMPALYLLPVLAVVAAVFAVLFAKKDKDFPAFCSNLLAFLFIVESGLASIYPYMLKSSVFPEYGIDIFEAASSHMTLGVMLGGALVFVPIVIIYQLWAYTLFREKITETEQVEY